MKKLATDSKCYSLAKEGLVSMIPFGQLMTLQEAQQMRQFYAEIGEEYFVVNVRSL